MAQQKKAQSNNNHLPEERLVVFIDILGFHGKVEEMSRKADIYERVSTLEIASDKQVVFRAERVRRGRRDASGPERTMSRS